MLCFHRCVSVHWGGGGRGILVSGIHALNTPPSSQPGQRYPFLPPPHSQDRPRQDYPSPSLPQPVRTDQDRGTLPSPTDQGQDGCAARAVCLLCLRRRTFLFINENNQNLFGIFVNFNNFFLKLGKKRLCNRRQINPFP